MAETLRAYELLDRWSDASGHEVRRVLDHWFSELPSLAAAEVSARFRDSDDGAHRGAFFELYLHALLRRLDMHVEMTVGRTSEGRIPDFAVRHGSSVAYVEATAVRGDDVPKPAKQQGLAQLRDAINDAHGPAFDIEMEVQRQGGSPPGRKTVTTPVQRWLDGLDPDALYAQHEATGGSSAQLRLQFHGWSIMLTAWALAPEHRQMGDGPILGGYSSGVESLDDVSPIRQAVRRKARHYGRLDRSLVVAVLCAGNFVDDKDVQAALFGRVALQYWTRQPGQSSPRARWVRQPDGAWRIASGPINTRVAAVLTCARLAPERVSEIEPTLWLNPWAETPLAIELPFRRIEFDGRSTFTETDATARAADILGLPAGWPTDSKRRIAKEPAASPRIPPISGTSA